MSEPANKDCPRRDRALGGCRFEPRYDEEPAYLRLFRDIAGKNIDFKIRSAEGAVRAYVGDVCVRCGRQVKRSEA